MVTTNDALTRNRRRGGGAQATTRPKTARSKTASRPPASGGRGAAFRHWPNRRYAWSRLQEVMIEKGLTPAMLTERTGFCSNSIYEWLLTTKTPRSATFHRLATILEVDATELRNSFPI